MSTTFLPREDQKLIQIVDAAFADSARRSGEWLVCKPGCSQCCHGVFAISQLDAARLRAGLTALEERDPERARRVRRRAAHSLDLLRPHFPGNAETGVLHEGHESDQRFSEFGNDEPCPALDPVTGTCDLYSARPMTCRVFGPPIRSEDGLGVCELCYHGATTEQIAACELTPDPDDLESQLLSQLESATGESGSTIVADCLARE